MLTSIYFFILVVLATNLYANETAIERFIIKQYEKNKQYTQQIKALEESTVQLKRQLERQNRAYHQLQETLLSTHQATKTSKITPQKTVALNNTDYRHARNLAFSGEYKKAITALLAYIEKYPNAQNIADAKFWLASSYVADGHFSDGAEKYLRFVNEHPQHYKIPDALYRLGIVQHELGSTKEAVALFESIIRRFPQHSIIPQVKESLRRLEKAKISNPT